MAVQAWLGTASVSDLSLGEEPMGVEKELSDRQAVLTAMSEFDRLGPRHVSREVRLRTSGSFSGCSQRTKIRREGHHWCCPRISVS